MDQAVENSKKKTNFGKHTQPDFILIKVAVIKTVGYWYKKRLLIYDNSTSTVQREKMVFSINGAKTIGYLYKKIKKLLISTSYHVSNVKTKNVNKYFLKKA